MITAASAALEERHMAVAEQYFELQLELGQSAELVGPLRELVIAHPLRETLRGRLMLALYRATVDRRRRWRSSAGCARCSWRSWASTRAPN
ncbi:BTAD domain-containing putative transcriptional regulator [Streptomyces lasalocidi]